MGREAIKPPGHFTKCYMEVWLQVQGHEHTFMYTQDMGTCRMNIWNIKQNHMFLFTVELPLPSLINDYLDALVLTC